MTNRKGQLSITRELGFTQHEYPNIELNGGDVQFIHSVPIEADLMDFRYVAIDSEKFYTFTKREFPEHFIPDNLDDIISLDFGFDPVGDFEKSKRKVDSLLAVYAKNGRIDIHSPVFAKYPPRLQAGRHRVWLTRYLGLPFFIAAANEEVFSKLKSLDLLYHPVVHSRYVFNQDLTIKSELPKA